MEGNKSKKTLYIVIIVVVLLSLFCLYLLNDKYGWLKKNNDKETIKKNDNTSVKEEQKEEEEVKDLTFNQRAFLDEIIKGNNNIDVNKVLSTSEASIKDTFINKITPINTALEISIKAKTDVLLEQSSISTDDIFELRKEMIMAADSYDRALGNLSGEADGFELYTTITYKAPLNNYYYFDGVEGVYLIEVNYAYLFNILKDKLTIEAKDYLILKSEVFKYNNGNYLYKDGGLGIEWNEFEKVILLYDDYVRVHPNETIVNNEYKTLFNIYIGIMELPNTPIYKEDGVTITTEVLNTYKDIIDNHKDFTKYNELKTKYESN